MNIDMTDDRFQDKAVTAVSAMAEDGSCQITTDDGWSFFVPATKVKIVVGDKVRFYGDGIGRPVRGLVKLGGSFPALVNEVIFYRTEAEEEERRNQYLAKEAQKKAADYEATKGDRKRRWDALPVEFQARAGGFIERRGVEWRHDFEIYELFVCEQAVAFAKALDVDGLKRFSSLPYDDQRAMVPEMSADHSGNTFGSACVLARLYLTDKSLVPKFHGALCPLVGCENYGCYSTVAKEVESK